VEWISRPKKSEIATTGRAKEGDLPCLFGAHLQPAIAGPVGNDLQLALIYGAPKFINRFIVCRTIGCINTGLPCLDHGWSVGDASEFGGSDNRNGVSSRNVVDRNHRRSPEVASPKIAPKFVRTLDSP
jgi:hypothetical protein